MYSHTMKLLAYMDYLVAIADNHTNAFKAMDRWVGGWHKAQALVVLE